MTRLNRLFIIVTMFMMMPMMMMADNGIVIIKSYNDLIAFASRVANGETSIDAELAADITINQNVLSPDGTMLRDVENLPSVGWSPIGTAENPYSGVFNGKGYAIKGLYVKEGTIDKFADLGPALFGHLSGATIQNLGIEDSYLYGFSGKTPASFAYKSNGSHFMNCYSLAVSRGYDNAAGLVATSINDEYECCFFAGVVCTLSTRNAAGIAFSMSGSRFDRAMYCRRNTETAFNNSGDCNGVECFNTAAISNGELAYMLNEGITDGTQTWYQRIGTDKTPTIRPYDNGYVYAGYTDCSNRVFTNTAGKYSAEPLECINYDEKGFCVGCGSYEAPECVDGWYEIRNSGNLYWVAYEVNYNENGNINVRLMNDIVDNKNVVGENGGLSGTIKRAWTPIGTGGTPFSGTFDGQNHEIRGLYCPETSSASGLFCYTDDANIKNVGIVDSYFSVNGSSGNHAASLISHAMFTTITKCYSNAVVDGELSDGIRLVAAGMIYEAVSCLVEDCLFGGVINAEFKGGLIYDNAASLIARCGSIYDDTMVYTEGVTDFQAGDIKSGKAAYVLNEGNTDGSQVWYQKIGTDECPVLINTGDNTVYEGFINCVEWAYTNNPNAVSPLPHETKNGICIACDNYYEQPERVKYDNLYHYKIENAGHLLWVQKNVRASTKDVKILIANDIDFNDTFVNEDGTVRIDDTLRPWIPFGADTNMDCNGWIVCGQGHVLRSMYVPSVNGYSGLFGRTYNVIIKDLGIEDSYFVCSDNMGYVGAFSASDNGETADKWDKRTNIVNCHSNNNHLYGGDKIGGFMGKSRNSYIRNSYILNVHFDKSSNITKGWFCAENDDVTCNNCYFCSKEDTSIPFLRQGNGVILANDCDRYNSNKVTYSYLPNKSKEDFASGCVAYILNLYRYEDNIFNFMTWMQELGKDGRPHLESHYDGREGEYHVFYAPKKCTDTRLEYSNIPLDDPSRHYVENGYCTMCDGMDAPKMDDEGVYEIYTCRHLFYFVYNNMEEYKKGKLMNDIVFTGSEGRLKCILNNPFIGEFDGQGHTVSGLFSDSNNGSGLFREAGKKGRQKTIIKNLGIINSHYNFSGAAEKTSYYTKYGVICNSLENGEIKSCYCVDTEINVGWYVLNAQWNSKENMTIAGICGKLGENSSIDHCYVEFTSTEGNSAKIIAEGDLSKVTDCYVSSDMHNGNDINYGTFKTFKHAQLETGELAYTWNNAITNGSQHWYQKIGTDPCPIAVKADENTVYKNYVNCVKKTLYTNLSAPTVDHMYSDGVCVLCNTCEKDGEWYTLRTPKMLNRVVEDINAGKLSNAKIRLACDIDMEGVNWNPMGTDSHYFTGIFDGQGHCIRNLNIGSSVNNQTGLIAYAKNATISNLRLEDSNIVGTHYVGMIGYADNCNINNVEMSGTTVSGQQSVGLIGYAVGVKASNVRMTNCNVSNTIASSGLVGHAINSEFTDMIVRGSHVSGIKNVGLVGYASNAVLTNLLNEGSEMKARQYVGGICGEACNSTVILCQNKSTVKAASSNGAWSDIAGGILGACNIAKIKDCLNTGDVNGKKNSSVGGLIGKFDPLFNTCERSYYLNTTADYAMYDVHEGAGVGMTDMAVTAEQCRNGYLAYELNGRSSDEETITWYQKIGTDEMPDRNPRSDAIVYAGYTTCSSDDLEFKNSAEGLRLSPSHNFVASEEDPKTNLCSVNCEICGEKKEYAAIVKNWDGKGNDLELTYNSAKEYFASDLVISDDAPRYFMPVKVKVKGCITYNHQFRQDDKKCTLVLPFQISSIPTSIAVFHTLSTTSGLISGKTLKFDAAKANKVNANTPCLVEIKQDFDKIELKAASSSSYAILMPSTGLKTDAKNPTSFNLYGTYTQITVPENAYCYDSDTDMFVKVGDSVEMLPFNAYIWTQGNVQNQSLSINTSSGIVNNIDAVNTDVTTTPVMYNLQGQRITTPRSGYIYIVNGKKYIMK